MGTLFKYMLILAAVMQITACAPAEIVNKERYFWPPPPSPPRVEWLGAYSSQNDLKMTDARRIREFIAGKDKEIFLRKPTEVRVDAELDKIYVSDAEAGHVYVYDLGQSDLRIISTVGAGLTERITPGALAVDGDGNLYILEPRSRKILVYNSAEQFQRVISLAENIKRPVALTIDKKRKRIYISDVQLNKVIALELDGTKLFEIGHSGYEEGAFNKPVGIAVNSKGNIVVADAFNARIQIFSDSGVFIHAFGRRGDSAGSFQLIKAVAVDADDNIYVADGRAHSINIYNQLGDLLQVIGSYYPIALSGKVAPGGFALPTAIDVDARGRIFVVDQMNARIQMFQYMPESDKTPSGGVAPAQAK